MTERLIVAIDPSIVKPGWAVLRVPDRRATLVHDVRSLYVDSGTWGTSPRDPLAERLAYLADCCRRLCAQYPPYRAYVEEPPITGTYSAHRGKSRGAQQAILGGSLAQMQRAAGVFLAVLGSHCPTEAVKAGNPAPGRGRGNAKAARRAIVLGYWPQLADRSEDEIDAIHLALTVATDARRRWAA